MESFTGCFSDGFAALVQGCVLRFIGSSWCSALKTELPAFSGGGGRVSVCLALVHGDP